MMPGTTYSQGDIVLVPFPFTDLSGNKQRPVLVISNDEYNEASLDLVTCAITSHWRDLRYGVSIAQENLQEGTIPLASQVLTAKIFTIEKTLVRKNQARLDAKTLSEVKRQLRMLFVLD